MKPTLSSSNQVKIEWLRRSHPLYTNYARATKDVLTRIGVKGAEWKLSSHVISHTTVDGELLRTQSLKVMTTAEQNEMILDGLIEA